MEAHSLSLTWYQSNLFYKECSMVPMDAGFVGALDLLPLKILNSEVTGRAVLSWHKWKKRVKQRERRLGLEVMVESRPTLSMVTSLLELCPAMT